MMLFNLLIAFLISNHLTDGLELSEKIVGGEQTNIFRAPYQVSIYYDGSHICGGSIISRNFVISAAHCFRKRGIKNFTVHVGGSYHNSPLQRIPIYRYKIHEGYVSAIYDNDIAIVQVLHQISYGPNALPIGLPYQDEPLQDGSIGTVSGWGLMQESIKIVPGKLRSVNLAKIPIELCRSLNFPRVVTDNMICAMDLENGGKDACQGDSGSGLISKGKLFGVTSWGIGCGRSDRAGVYTNIAKYRNWIKLYTGI